MKRIYIFQRLDGSHGADFGFELANRLGVLVDTIDLATKADTRRLIEKPYRYCPDRVRALAERALLEFQEPPPQVGDEVGNRGLFGRLKWALFRK